jgi:uncharacterized membrane protein YjjP (DUF1212 family)
MATATQQRFTTTRRLASSADESVAPEVEFLLRFAAVGHGAGYTTQELEERVLALAHSFGIRSVQVSVIPTLVEVSFGSLSRQRTHTLRVRPATLDLSTTSRLDDLFRAAVDTPLTPDVALVRLEEIRAGRTSYPYPAVIAAYALAAAALAPVLGGGWREIVAATVAGACVGGIAVVLHQTARTGPIVAPVAAIVASFCAAAAAHLGLGVSTAVVAPAALVSLLPGMTLAIGVRELATEHLQSGTANTASGLAQLLGLVFGVEIGRSIALTWFGPLREAAPHTTLTAPHILAAIVAGLAFTVSLNARARDAVLMCSATALALVADHVSSALVGETAGTVGAALAVGVFGTVTASLLRRSPLVLLVPGVLMLVPGSSSFNSALQLLTYQAGAGLAALDTFVTALSVAYGLMIATLVVPSRFMPTER